MNNQKLTVQYCVSEDFLPIKPGDEETSQSVLRAEVVLFKFDRAGCSQIGVVASTQGRDYLFLKTRGPIPLNYWNSQADKPTTQSIKKFDLQTSVSLADLITFAEDKAASVQKSVIKTTDAGWCVEVIRFLDPQISGFAIGSSVVLSDAASCLFVVLIVGVVAYIAYLAFNRSAKKPQPAGQWTQSPAHIETLQSQQADAPRSSQTETPRPT